MTALASRLIQAAWMIPTALFLGWWAWQCVQVWVQRARAMRAHELKQTTSARHGACVST